jgi:hypothetical protein
MTAPSGLILMLFLSAIVRVAVPQEPPPNDLLASVRFRLGNLGLTIITLVDILVTYWQR